MFTFKYYMEPKRKITGLSEYETIDDELYMEQVNKMISVPDEVQRFKWEEGFRLKHKWTKIRALPTTNTGKAL